MQREHAAVASRKWGFDSPRLQSSFADSDTAMFLQKDIFGGIDDHSVSLDSRRWILDFRRYRSPSSSFSVVPTSLRDREGWNYEG